MKAARKIVMDPFCHKQFDKATSSFIDFPIEEFTEHCDAFYKENPSKLIDGYAPFCKHLFIPNWTSALVGSVKITDENREHLRSGYEARRSNELAVLCQWMDITKVPASKAAYLDIILYSREQIIKENESTGMPDPNKDHDYDYGIVSVKPTDVDYETPMQPITVMRNALGKD